MWILHIKTLILLIVFPAEESVHLLLPQDSRKRFPVVMENLSGWVANGAGKNLFKNFLVKYFDLLLLYI